MCGLAQLSMGELCAGFSSLSRDSQTNIYVNLLACYDSTLQSDEIYEYETTIITIIFQHINWRRRLANHDAAKDATAGGKSKDGSQPKPNGLDDKPPSNTRFNTTAIQVPGAPRRPNNQVGRLAKRSVGLLLPYRGDNRHTALRGFQKSIPAHVTRV